MSFSTAPKPTLYFDGACPVCSREIAMCRSQTGSEAIDWVDVTCCPVGELGDGLTREAAMARLHLRQPDGRPLSGAAAFAALWRALPRGSWLGRVAGTAIGLMILEAGYRAFLALRPLWRRRGLAS